MEKPINKNMLLSFVLNCFLILSALLTSISGLILQMGFHVGGHHGHGENTHSQINNSQDRIRTFDLENKVMGLNHGEWSLFHKITIVIFTLLIIYHLYKHWNWYKGVISKKLLGKNKQVMILSVLFLISALTGLIPWFMGFAESKNILRMVLIELHDKISLILIVFLILHLIKRAKWFTNTGKKLVTH
jgi:hypothetical protein